MEEEPGGNGLDNRKDQESCEQVEIEVLEDSEVEEMNEEFVDIEVNWSPVIRFLERNVGEETLHKGGKAFPVGFPLLLFLLAICIIIYPMLVIHFQYNNPGVWDYNQEELRDIYLTKEYQLILHPEIFAPRDKAVSSILKVFAETSGLEVYNTSKKHIGVRSQFKYNPWNCTNWQDIDRFEYSEYMSALYYEENGHGYYDEYGFPINATDHDETYVSDTELRVRNWLYVKTGGGLHTSTIDIKKQVSNMTEALNFHFRAAPDQIDGSTEKLEQG